MGRINLDQLYNRIKLNRSAARNSMTWFEEKIRYMKNVVSPNSVMNNPQRRQDFIIPGQMYLYFYHPKGIDELPYYDTFPLVIPFSMEGETFTGINFHYLPPKLRTMLLANMMDFSTDTRVKEKTRLKFQWDFIRGVSRYKGVEFAVKRYRFDHVASQFLFIPANQWFNAIMLPVEKFSTGASMARFSKDIVWRDAIGNL